MLFLHMDETHSESGDIAIRCPGCGQRFKVGPDLRGRMVECGSCDQRFRVDDEVTVRQRKIYPGERRDASLDRFSRVPTKSAVAPTFQPIYYESEVPSPVVVNPTSPFRVILGIAGVTGAVLVILVLMFGGGAGGLLDGASTSKRLILSVFTGILTIVLLFVANPHGRMKAGLVGAAFAAVLIALPFFFKEGSGELVSNDAVILAPTQGEVEVVSDDPFEDLKEEMHYEPVEEALAAYGPTYEAQGKTAVGVWLRDLRDFNKLQVVEYLTRSTNASGDSWLYPRGSDDFLMVLIDVENDIEKVAKLCGRFGEVARVIEDIRVIEVKVENESFVQGALEKLNNPDNPSFYELNRRELESIDLRRMEEAVKRLAVAEPRLFRPDIVKRMQELFPLADEEMTGDLAKALIVWAEEGDGSVEVVRDVAVRLMASESEVPRPVIAFMVQNKDEAVIPILDELWATETGSWENLYGEMGSPIEDLVLKRFEEGSPTIKISAATLLAKVGTEKSLPALKKESEGARSEMAVVVNRAIEAIEARR